MTAVEAGVLNPRESLQVALTVMDPGEVPVVFRVAELPLPETLPPVADQPATLVCMLSGLLQVPEMLDVPPTCTVDGLADNENVGGFFGGSFTVKLAEQVACPPFFILGSVTCAETV